MRALATDPPGTTRATARWAGLGIAGVAKHFKRLMSPPAVQADGTGASAVREGATRSGRNVQSAYMVKPSTANDSGAKEGKEEKPANWNATAPAPRKKGEKSGGDAEDGTSTPGPNTPATTNSGGTPAKRPAPETSSGGQTGGEPPAKKQRATWSAEAVALGYETGTIKHAAYVLLAASGTSGMTVASIVESAQKQGLYSWGTCKTPNNSVTAALSQDTTFVRIAPSTYALRSSLRGGGGTPLPQPQRTSSGSTNSAANREAESARADSGSASQGAVAGGRSKGSNANSKPEKSEREAHTSSHRGQGGGEFSGGYANALAQQLHQAGRVAGGKETAAKRLAMESYKRRMDVYAGQVERPVEEERNNVFPAPGPVRPLHSPDKETAGSCLFFYPAANPPAPPPKKPEPPKEPTEGLKRANSWKDEAKEFASADLSGIQRTSSGHLPSWVLDQFRSESKNPIAAA